MTPEELGARLRQARESAGMSLKGVEKVSAGRFRAAAVGTWERGERNPTFVRVAELIELYAEHGAPVRLGFGDE